MKILRVLSTKKRYGGDLYEDEAELALKAQHQVDVFNPVPEYEASRLMALPQYFSNLGQIGGSQDYDMVIRAMNHVFRMKSDPKQVVIAYHYDTAFCHPLVKMHHYATLKSLVAQKNKVHKIVVIAKYWAEFFHQLGFKNIETIYCGFDQTQFQISEQDVEQFKTKYNLHGKKLLYIGNSQKKKGAHLVYEALKDSDYFMVTSGNKDVDLPILNLSLKHHEYLCLLKAAGTVVTYSQFKEGWNRVAHEAMLVGTPVIGSGMGGMGELLQGGNQAVCTNLGELPELLKKYYGNQDLALAGKDYAESFTMERFNKAWLDLVQK